jgi:hypothetical protein
LKYLARHSGRVRVRRWRDGTDEQKKELAEDGGRMAQMGLVMNRIVELQRPVRLNVTERSVIVDRELFTGSLGLLANLIEDKPPLQMTRCPT